MWLILILGSKAILILILGLNALLSLGSKAILSYTHLQLQHAPIRLDIYHSSSSSSPLPATSDDSDPNNIHSDTTWPCHVSYTHPHLLYSTCLSNDISPIHWCIVVLTTIRSSSRICSMHHTISRAHLYTSLRFQNSAIHFHTDSTPPTHITTHALPHIAYLWTLHNVYRTMHYPPISNLIRLCTKYNSTIHRYDMTPLVHTYTTESSSIHFNGDRPHSVPVRAIPVNYGSTNIPDHCHLCFQMIHILQP